jgi:GNAT superfamily N-acetyltransferase
MQRQPAGSIVEVERLTIRRASLEDLEALVKLRLALLQEVGNLKESSDVAAFSAATRKYLTQKIPTGNFIAWVAEAESQLIASSGVVMFERPPVEGNSSGLEAFVMNIYTIPAWRRHGIATRLLQETIQFVFGETGAKRIWLHATDEGQQLYEQLGFVTAKLPEIELSWESFIRLKSQ